MSATAHLWQKTDFSWKSRSSQRFWSGSGACSSVLLTLSSYVAQSKWWRRWTWGRRRSMPGWSSDRTNRLSHRGGSGLCRWRLRSWCTGRQGAEISQRWWTSFLCWGWRAEPQTQRCPGWRIYKRARSWPALPGGTPVDSVREDLCSSISRQSLSTEPTHQWMCCQSSTRHCQWWPPGGGWCL